MTLILILSALACLIALFTVAPRVAVFVVCAPFLLWVGMIFVLMMKG
jgi:hypothetical protein